MEIINVVAHQIYINNNGAWADKYSNQPLDISNVDQTTINFKKFISDHIENSRLDPSAMAASFLDLETNNTFGYIKDSFDIEENVLLTDNDGSIKMSENYFENTKKLTRRIKDKIKSTASRSSAIILFAIFSDAKGVGFSILKMDPRTGYSIDNDFTINIWENILPDREAHLHKTMILRLFDKNNKYDSDNLNLFVLDKQNSSGKESKFFLTNFLEAQKIADDKRMTTEILNSFPNYMEGMLDNNDSVISLFNDLKISLNKGGNFSLDSDLFKISKPYLKDKKMDEQEFIDEISDKYLLKLEESYSSVTKSFNAVPSQIKEFIIKNKHVKISVDKGIDVNMDLEIKEDKTKHETTIIFKNGIGEKLIQKR